MVLDDYKLSYIIITLPKYTMLFQFKVATTSMNRKCIRECFKTIYVKDIFKRKKESEDQGWGVKILASI